MSELFPVRLEGAMSTRRGQVLVGPVDLALDGSGTCVVIGPNGAGKTTLLRMMHGAARVSRGTITWTCTTEEAHRHQAFVFQRPVMLHRSVEANLAYPLLVHGTSRRDAREAAADWAARVGLLTVLNRPATSLSGGEQQKLAIARALIGQPKLLFLDEPCAALDGRAMREIEDILLAAKAAGTVLIMSTHNMGQARRLADQVVFMLQGRVHEQGAAERFFDRPETSDARAFLKGDIVE